MKKLLDYFKEHKKIIVIIALLAALIIAAVIMFGSKAGSLQTSATNGVAKSESEIKLTRILTEIDGVGKAEVMINEGENGVEGVIIVCEGAYNIMTRNDILNAVTTAFNVNKNNIAIYAMNK